eukprot:g3535.t1
MAHPAMKEDEINLGLYDQQTALKWIDKNIGMFGGDNKKVILMGQSAGAISTCWHLASPESRKYFHAAAMFSGNCYGSFVWRTRDEAEEEAKEYLDSIGCTKGNDQQQLECARKKTSVKVLKNSTGSKEGVFNVLNVFSMLFRGSKTNFQSQLNGHLPYAPVVDNYKSSPFYKLSDIDENFPVLLMSTEDEGSIFRPVIGAWVKDAHNMSTNGQIRLAIERLICPSMARLKVDGIFTRYECSNFQDKIIAAYTVACERNPSYRRGKLLEPNLCIAERIIRDYIFTCPTLKAMQKLKERGDHQKVFGYYLKSPNTWTATAADDASTAADDASADTSSVADAVVDIIQMQGLKRFMAHHMIDMFFLFQSSFKTLVGNFNNPQTQVEVTISSIFQSLIRDVLTDNDGIGDADTIYSIGGIGGVNSGEEFENNRYEETNIIQEEGFQEAWAHHNCDLYENVQSDERIEPQQAQQQQPAQPSPSWKKGMPPVPPQGERPLSNDYNGGVGARRTLRSPPSPDSLDKSSQNVSQP